MSFSAVRLAYDDKVILNTLPIQSWLNRLGEGLFNHETPDGYAMTSASWNGPGQMMLRFEIARQIGSGSSGLFKPEGPNAVDQPAFPLIANSLYFNGLRQTLGPTTLGRARSGDLAAGLEYAVPVVARVHALTQATGSHHESP